MNFLCKIYKHHWIFLSFLAYINVSSNDRVMSNAKLKAYYGTFAIKLIVASGNLDEARSVNPYVL